jgi:alkylated DNA repair dioxygenase AlkB
MRQLRNAHRLRLVDASLDYVAGFLSPAEADAFLGRLQRDVPWQQHHVRIAGKRIPSPRLSAWYGDPGLTYAYSGMVLRTRGWIPVLADLRERVDATTSHHFNTVLVIRYRDGADSMGWHADDERELGPQPVIASISLGVIRGFSLAHRSRKDVPPVRIELEHGSLLLMAGETQKHWRHSLPKTRKPIGERINLTFRRIVSGDELCGEGPVPGRT